MVRLYAYIWLAWAVSTLAQLQRFTPPGQDESTYRVTIPQDTATITEHDNFGVTSLNLKRATGGSLETLFKTSTASTSAPTMSTTGTNSINLQITAHAVLMLVTFTFLFPSFALSLHLFPSFWTVKLHASFQLLTLGLAVAGMGFGISIAKTTSQISTYHPIIGIGIVSSLVLYQPVMGLLQHRYFRKTGGKSSFAYLHRWFGRVLVSLGVINGGLGFNLAGVGSPGAPLSAVIAYSVVAGFVGLGYIFVIWLVGRKKRQEGAA